MRRYDAIHFDMDGVLADTEPLHVAAEQQTCRDFDFAIDSKTWGGFKGQPAEAIFSYLLQHYGDPQKQSVASLVRHKTDIFLGMAAENLKPIAGALDFLDWSRNHYSKLTLVTSSSRRVQQYITRTLNIAGHFDAITTGDDITMGKPHPEPYLRAVSLAGVPAEESFVIEDSKSGILSGLAARCSVLAVATSHTVEELLSVEPTLIAADFTHAKCQLAALGKE